MPYYVKGFRNKPVRDSWVVKYQMLKKYTDVHKRIPKYKYLSLFLSNWIKYQRERYLLKKGSPLSKNEIKLLEALPGWKWDRRRLMITPKESKSEPATELATEPATEPATALTPATELKPEITPATELEPTPATELALTPATELALTPATELAPELAPTPIIKRTHSVKNFETLSDVSKLKANEPIKSELDLDSHYPLELLLKSNLHQTSPKTIKVRPWVISLFPKLLDHYADCNFYSSRINRILVTNKFD